jgi:hypothetical protein
VYSDFYKIPLPALRFENVEEITHKSEQKQRRDNARPRQKFKAERKKKRQRKQHFKERRFPERHADNKHWNLQTTGF